LAEKVADLAPWTLLGPWRKKNKNISTIALSMHGAPQCNARGTAAALELRYAAARESAEREFTDCELRYAAARRKKGGADEVSEQGAEEVILGFFALVRIKFEHVKEYDWWNGWNNASYKERLWLTSDPKLQISNGAAAPFKDQQYEVCDEDEVLRMVPGNHLEFGCTYYAYNGVFPNTITSTTITIRHRVRPLAHAWLVGANLKGANLSDAQLVGTNLSNAVLQGMYLRRANLKGANLKDSKVQAAYLSDADLMGANLNGAKLQGTTFHDATMSGAYLISAHLQEANLNGTNLQGAILRNADMRGARLTGTWLQGTDLSSADLTPLPGVEATQLKEELAKIEADKQKVQEMIKADTKKLEEKQAQVKAEAAEAAKKKPQQGEEGETVADTEAAGASAGKIGKSRSSQSASANKELLQSLGHLLSVLEGQQKGGDDQDKPTKLIKCQIDGFTKFDSTKTEGTDFTDVVFLGFNISKTGTMLKLQENEEDRWGRGGAKVSDVEAVLPSPAPHASSLHKKPVGCKWLLSMGAEAYRTAQEEDDDEDEDEEEDEDADDAAADTGDSSGDDNARMPHAELTLFAVRLGFCAYMVKRNDRAVLRRIVLAFKRLGCLAPALLAMASAADDEEKEKEKLIEQVQKVALQAAPLLLDALGVEAAEAKDKQLALYLRQLKQVVSTDAELDKVKTSDSRDRARVSTRDVYPLNSDAEPEEKEGDEQPQATISDDAKQLLMCGVAALLAKAIGLLRSSEPDGEEDDNDEEAGGSGDDNAADDSGKEPGGEEGANDSASSKSTGTGEQSGRKRASFVAETLGQARTSLDKKQGELAKEQQTLQTMVNKRRKPLLWCCKGKGKSKAEVRQRVLVEELEELVERQTELRDGLKKLDKRKKRNEGRSGKKGAEKWQRRKL
jgi:hypothetical protein